MPAAFRVAALFRYPLKSAAGEPCAEVTLDRFGVQGDRRWMIVDGDGAPLTQRELPTLACLSARATPSGLAVVWGGSEGDRIQVERPPDGSPRHAVAIWGDTVALPHAEAASNGWLSERIGREASFAYMPADVERPVNPRYAEPRDRTSLTDGYPLHVIGSGSLADLNRRLEEPVGIERFRPNVLVDGPGAFDEDDWDVVRVGDAELRVVKPCPRCAVTTVDPATGIRGKEPLRTLADYRRREGGVMFGQNALHPGSGRLRVGDAVVVLSRRGARAD